MKGRNSGLSRMMFAVAWGFACGLQAADKTWSGGVNANWGDSSVWTPVGVPASGQSVSISNSVNGVSLTVQNGTAAAASSVSFDNVSGKSATLSIADGGSLTVSGVVTNPGAGSAIVLVYNTNPANATNRLATTALSAYEFDSTGYLAAGFDMTLAVLFKLNSAANNAFTQTNGTISSANSGYGLTFIEESSYSATPNTARYVLDGGALAHDRIGVGDGNGNNSSVPRWIDYGVLTFNNGTIQTRTSGGTVFLQNGSGYLNFTNQVGGVRDMQMATHHPLTVELSQNGTHTFNAQGSAGKIYVSPSVQLVNKSGEAGTLRKIGLGDLVLTGGASNGVGCAVNSYTGPTTVEAGQLVVDYSQIAGFAGGGALSNAYSKGSKLVLNGGNFVMTGRANAGAVTKTGTLSVSSYDVDLGTFAGTNIVVGQAVSHPGLLPGTYLRRQPYGPSSGWVSLSHLPTNAVTGASLQFDAARYSSIQEIDAVECWSNATVTVNPAGDDTLLTFGSISGIGGLTKAGTGKLRLVGAVTFTGTNNISAGTLDFAGTANNTLSNAVVGSGTFRQSGTCTTTVDSATASINTFNGAVAVDGGALLLGDVITDNCGLNTAASYTVTTNGTLIVRRNAMSQGAVALIGGTLRTDSSSTFQTLGAVTLNGGTLQSGPGFASVYNGFAINNSVTVTGSVPSVIQAAAGAYNGIHLAFYAGAPGRRTFNVADVTGNANADLTVSAVLLESSHNTMSYGLAKTGAGTMVLTATNTYSGATIISNGTLLVSGGMPNSAVTVATNAAFGTAGATVSRVASLTLAEGSKVVWKYDGNAQTAGRINVTGTLTLPSAATLDVSGAGYLYSNQALFSAGSVAGATNLSGWTITGATKTARAAVVGNQVVLLTNRGTLISVR